MIDKLVRRKKRSWPSVRQWEHLPQGTEEDSENVEDSRSRG
jgi:hypothetical protein